MGKTAPVVPSADGSHNDGRVGAENEPNRLPVNQPRPSSRAAEPDESPASRPRLPVRVGEIVDIGRQTYESWRQDRTLRLGAGLAFYALFTIVPLLALTAALADLLFGSLDMQKYFAERLAQFGLLDAEDVSVALTRELSRGDVQSSLGIIGLGSLLFASSLMFLAFVDAINVIWDVPVRSGVWHSVRRRLVAFLMVLVAGGVMIAGFAVTAVAGAAEKLLPSDPELLGTLADVIAGLASWVSLAFALALLFRFLIPVRVRWSRALLAGVITAVLLVIGTIGIGWYLRRFGGSSVAGAFGAVLAILTWVYYESQIVLGGVQLVKVLTISHPEALLELRDASPREGADQSGHGTP